VWANALPGIERFHFVEYGLVRPCFSIARCWRMRSGALAEPTSRS
jgi:hypothetical protein